MISEIRISDISKCDFVYTPHFRINDISTCINEIKKSVNDTLKLFNEVTTWETCVIYSFLLHEFQNHRYSIIIVLFIAWLTMRDLLER